MLYRRTGNITEQNRRDKCVIIRGMFPDTLRNEKTDMVTLVIAKN